MPSFLSSLGEADFAVSQWVYQHNVIPHSWLHALSTTGEGYFWLVAPIPFAIICKKMKYPEWYEVMWTNLWILNVVDLIFIAACKQIFRRPRPNYQLTNSTAKFLASDKYSFPSGHTSRAISVAALLIIYRSSYSQCVLYVLWALSVSASRLLLGRHYLTDLAGGAALASLNIYVFLNYMRGAFGVHELLPFSKDFFLTRK
eukprot:TRINITY_DN37713_c0_g1_i1.p1 TRINITY_DN37713_c0_g1~~TRINITY_DN37713_c0_g1_i1.p1  ORF type:complete len:201 (+),score=43.14 TRINITY_DN37713_c0_g1_i1:207-809(+)